MSCRAKHIAIHNSVGYVIAKAQGVHAILFSRLGPRATNDSLSKLDTGSLGDGAYRTSHRIAHSGYCSCVRSFARSGLPGNCGGHVSETFPLSAELAGSGSCTAVRVCGPGSWPNPESYSVSPCSPVGVAHARVSSWSLLEYGIWRGHSIGGAVRFFGDGSIGLAGRSKSGLAAAHEYHSLCDSRDRRSQFCRRRHF
jgi:hypothetical protein